METTKDTIKTELLPDGGERLWFKDGSFMDLSRELFTLRNKQRKNGECNPSPLRGWVKKPVSSGRVNFVYNFIFQRSYK